MNIAGYSVAVSFVLGIFTALAAGKLRRALFRMPPRMTDLQGAGLWALDHTGRIAWANPRIAEILGLSPPSLTGRKFEDFLFPEDLSAERIRFTGRRPGFPEQFDRRLRRADGSEVWLLTSSDALAPERGSRHAILSVMIDITERKQAELTLRRSERQFRGLFENIVEGVYQTTPDGRIIAANPMLLRMLGLSCERELNEVVAVDLYADPTTRQWLTGRLEREGSFRNVVYELRRRDGYLITVRENARVVRDDQGRVLYYEGTLTDITQQKADHRSQIQ